MSETKQKITQKVTIKTFANFVQKTFGHTLSLLDKHEERVKELTEALADTSKLTATQAEEYTKELTKLNKTDLRKFHNLPSFATGAAGIGKSQSIKAVADALNLELIDIRLTQEDPVTFNGMPSLNHEKRTTGFYTSDRFPTTDWELPEGKKGWLLLFDELPDANPIIQTASYKIILDRMVGDNTLHPRVCVTALGNGKEDGGFAGNIRGTIANRTIRFSIDSTSENARKEWAEWAISAKIHPAVYAMVHEHTDHFNTFAKFKDSNEINFAAPRTWEAVSNLMKSGIYTETEIFPALHGLLGATTAEDFCLFLQVAHEVPKIQEIIDYAEVIAIPATTVEHGRLPAMYLYATLVQHLYGIEKLEEFSKAVKSIALYLHQDMQLFGLFAKRMKQIAMYSPLENKAFTEIRKIPEVAKRIDEDTAQKAKTAYL